MMNIRFFSRGKPAFLLLFAFLAILATGCARLPFRCAGKDKAFSIVVLPDTQIYSLRHPEIFRSQTEWVRSRKDKWNILCVVHEGDITHVNSEKEWRNADAALSVLDGEVPCCLAIGNHDMSKGGTGKTRETELFDRFFPVSRFAKEPWYGGHYQDSMQNAYYRFEVSGLKVLVMCLEFGPRDEVLEWANGIVARHKNHRTIVVTHNYMYSDDTRSGEGDKWNPHGYGCGGNDGEEMWTKFVKKHENMSFVLSGHILNDGLGLLTSTGEHGNRVHEILANYQMKPNGGNGWLRIMRFEPRENRVRVLTYSPWLKKWDTGSPNQFDLVYPE